MEGVFTSADSDLLALQQPPREVFAMAMLHAFRHMVVTPSQWTDSSMAWQVWDAMRRWLLWNAIGIGRDFAVSAPSADLRMWSLPLPERVQVDFAHFYLPEGAISDSVCDALRDFLLLNSPVTVVSACPAAAGAAAAAAAVALPDSVGVCCSGRLFLFALADIGGMDSYRFTGAYHWADPGKADREHRCREPGCQALEPFTKMKHLTKHRESLHPAGGLFTPQFLSLPLGKVGAMALAARQRQHNAAQNAEMARGGLNSQPLQWHDQRYMERLSALTATRPECAEPLVQYRLDMDTHSAHIAINAAHFPPAGQPGVLIIEHIRVAMLTRFNFYVIQGLRKCWDRQMLSEQHGQVQLWQEHLLQPPHPPPQLRQPACRASERGTRKRAIASFLVNSGDGTGFSMRGRC